ncbi:hypothetical protein O0S10_01975 [Methanocorpusculum sp. MG]|uniref:PGF-CTERM sorting domain-containing protein n=1 Tax=Methanocorpusculum petauri TaxID=3002863 RepID=A0ABT4IEJ2_9EURY|nr:hypothetical protein [Methanocorpusculum petauri]MCZ0859996.1 hypothetical protein [Methanocorpusculum petauri]
MNPTHLSPQSRTAEFLRITAAALLLLLLLTAGTAAADDTIQISPSVLLTFENVPAELLTGSEIGIDAAAEITGSTRTILKNAKAGKIINAAYAVALTPKGFSKSDIIKADIRLPVSGDWSGAHKHIYAAAITGDTCELLTVTLIGTGGDGNIIFEAVTRGLPDMILLVATENAADLSLQQTAVPTASAPATAQQTPDRTTAAATPSATLVEAPAPAAGALLGLLAAALITTRRRWD